MENVNVKNAILHGIRRKPFLRTGLKNNAQVIVQAKAKFLRQAHFFAQPTNAINAAFAAALEKA